MKYCLPQVGDIWVQSIWNISDYYLIMQDGSANPFGFFVMRLDDGEQFWLFIHPTEGSGWSKAA